MKHFVKLNVAFSHWPAVTMYLLLIVLLLGSCRTTNYYIVRHAEKADNSSDPPLSDLGAIRALVLADTLRKKNLRRIFVSTKIRTQQTAAPTVTLFQLTPTIVDVDSTDALIRALKKMNNRNVLVVWHQDKVHTVVNALLPASLAIEPIGNEFGNLFVVQKRVLWWQTKRTLRKLHYGAPG